MSVNNSKAAKAIRRVLRSARRRARPTHKQVVIWRGPHPYVAVMSLATMHVTEPKKLRHLTGKKFLGVR